MNQPEKIELDNLDENKEENDGFEETNFGGTEENPYENDLLDDDNEENPCENDLLDDDNEETSFDEDAAADVDDWMSKGRDYTVEKFKKYFGERAVKALDIYKLFKYAIVDVPEDNKNIRFIKYLLDRLQFEIVNTHTSEESVDFDFRYYINDYEYNFKTERGKMNINDFNDFSSDLNYFYDNWKIEVLKQRIKKGCLVGGIGLAIAGLVSGLILGLKRTGHSMVQDSKVKWEKLTPAEKKQIVIPWTELEKASGKGVILIGDYLYVLIGGTILIYLIKKYNIW